MKPKLILSLALVLSVFILRPAPVRAEDRIWVDGKINGQPVRLAFDTGASGPVLFKKSAERLGLKFTPPSDATAPNEVTVGITEVCEFELSGDVHKMYFHVLDLPDFLSSQDTMDGVLGWEALTGNVLLIDASRGLMTALAVLPEEVKTWQQFRVQTNEDVLILEIPGERPTNTIFIDTGRHTGIGLAPEDWPAWKNTHRNQRLTLRAGYLPAAGVYVAEEAWADKISFGPLLLTDVPVSEAHATEIYFPSVKATFGIAALKRMELVVDGTRGIAYVNPKRQPATPYDHNRLGAVFVPADFETDNDLIAHAAVGSPAQKAGVRNGDVLLKVGDQDMTNWRTNRVKQTAFWEQPPGTEHRLTLRRGLQTKIVTVKLEQILGPEFKAGVTNPAPDFQQSRAAAQAGDRGAQANLGLLFLKGIGTGQSDTEAAYWFRKAAGQGDAQSQHNLGVLYSEGKGVPKNPQEALKWYRRAAEQNYTESFVNIAGMYYEGEGVPQDYAEAHKWIRRAAERGLPQACNNLATMYDHGRGVATNYAEALHWYRKSAEAGDPVGQHALGIKYANGKGPQQDDAMSAAWFRKAADQGKAESQFNLGFLYMEGKGVAKDASEAVKLYKLAAIQGNASAQLNLGICLAAGIGVKADLIEGYKWLTLAANQGETKAAQAIQLFKNLTPEQIAEAKRRAESFQPKLNPATSVK